MTKWITSWTGWRGCANVAVEKACIYAMATNKLRGFHHLAESEVRVCGAGHIRWPLSCCEQMRDHYDMNFSPVNGVEYQVALYDCVTASGSDMLYLDAVCALFIHR